MKSLIGSRTFWFNVAKFIGGTALMYTTTFPDSKYVGIAVIIEALISLILRLDTSKPITTVLPVS